MAALRDLVDVRSQRALRLKAHLEPLADGSAWPRAPWLRQAGHTLDAVYAEPDVVRRDRARQPETVDEELQAAVAPSGDERERAPWAGVWPGVTRAVILGRPGEGKTTLLQRTCQRVADASAKRWEARTSPLADIPVPIWVRADDIMRAGSVHAALGLTGPQAAPPTIDLPLSVEDRRAALQRCSTWLFIDALDERPDEVSPSQAVAALASLRDVPARILLSVRGYAWKETDLPFTVASARAEAEGADTGALTVYDLAPLTRAQRAWVVAAWCADDADRRDQLTALLDVAPMRELTSNALLLTLLCATATADRSRTISKDTRRAELYAWLATDLVTRADKNPLDPNSRAAQDRLLAVERAAWALWQRHPGGAFPYQTWADQLRIACGERLLSVEVYQAIQTEVERTGLLVTDGPNRRLFPQTAYEYLAGAGLVQDADVRSEEPSAIARTLASHAGDTAWREMSLLAIGHLAAVRKNATLTASVVAATLSAQEGPPGAAAALMGEALVEALPEPVTDETWQAVVGPLLERRTVNGALIATMRDEIVRDRQAVPVAAMTRAAAGSAIGRLGDPRFRPDAWCLPDDVACGFAKSGADALLGFVRIPAGPFTMGSNPTDDKDARPNEQPQRSVTLAYDYYIARWPVTVAQFWAFCDDKEGNEGFEPRYPNCLRGVANHPVAYVSWQDAVKYCAWLMDTLRERARVERAGLPAWRRVPKVLATLLLEGDGQSGAWAVALPSEAEWEKAARAHTAWIYPWGPEADPNRANDWDENVTGLEGTSAVGCFPGGASPCAVEELAGNVGEWTRSESRPYPYDPVDGRESMDASSSVHRVVRGGSFGSDERIVRSACRIDGFEPDDRSYNIGFRVGVAPFPSDL